LGTIRSPNRLDLVALEGEGNIVLMLDDVAGKRDSEVIPETFFADLRGERLFKIGTCKSVPGIEDAEQEFVTLLTVFAKQG
jgi:hypothetical protein